MSGAFAEAAISTAPLSMASVAYKISSSSSSSTFQTFAQKPTPISSHHAPTITITKELVRAVDQDWLSGHYLNTVAEISKRNEKLLRGIRLGIGFGAAVFALLLIGAVYVGIRCCRKKPSDEEDNSSMEISGVQYEMREEYGPKPLSRCSTCATDVVRAESSLQTDSGVDWSGRARSQDVTEGEGWRREAIQDDRAMTRVSASL